MEAKVIPIVIIKLHIPRNFTSKMRDERCLLMWYKFTHKMRDGVVWRSASDVSGMASSDVSTARQTMRRYLGVLFCSVSIVNFISLLVMTCVDSEEEPS